MTGTTIDWAAPEWRHLRELRAALRAHPGTLTADEMTELLIVDHIVERIELDDLREQLAMAEVALVRRQREGLYRIRAESAVLMSVIIDLERRLAELGVAP